MSFFTPLSPSLSLGPPRCPSPLCPLGCPTLSPSICSLALLCLCLGTLLRSNLHDTYLFHQRIPPGAAPRAAGLQRPCLDRSVTRSPCCTRVFSWTCAIWRAICKHFALHALLLFPASLPSPGLSLPLSPWCLPRPLSSCPCVLPFAGFLVSLSRRRLGSVLRCPPPPVLCYSTTRDTIRGTPCPAPPFTPAPGRAASYLLALCPRPSVLLLPPLSMHALCERCAKQNPSPRLSVSLSAPVVWAPVLLLPSPSPAFWLPCFCPLRWFSRTMRNTMHDNLRSTLHDTHLGHLLHLRQRAAS